LSRRSSLLRPTPTASRPLRHFPGSPVIGERRFPPPRRRRGRGGSPQFPGRPSARSTPNTPEGSRRPLPDPRRLPWPSPSTNRLGTPSSRPKAAALTTLAQASLALQTGRSLRPASHPASRPRTEASLPGTRASPRTGLTPAGRPELVARLRHDGLLSLMAPESSGRTRRNPALSTRATGRRPEQAPPCYSRRQLRFAPSGTPVRECRPALPNPRRDASAGRPTVWVGHRRSALCQAAVQ
jgi:hypothetical protein